MLPFHVHKFINRCANEVKECNSVFFSKFQLDVEGISTKEVKDVGQPLLAVCPSMDCSSVCHDGRMGSMLKWL